VEGVAPGTGINVAMANSTLQSSGRKVLPFPKKPQGWKKQILDK